MKSISNTLIAAIFALIITAVVVGLLQTHFFSSKELQTSDQLMLLRYQWKVDTRKPDSRIVFCAVDEPTVNDFEIRWPFPRDMHGHFLALLETAKPRVVGWDVFFTEEHAIPIATPPAPAPAPPADPNAPATAQPPVATPTEDDILVEGASLIPRLVTASRRDDFRKRFTKEEILPTRPLTNVTGDISKLLSAKSAALPIPALRAKSTFGFADEETLSVVRRTMPLMVNINGMVLPSLDMQILLQYWNVDPDKVVVKLGHEVVIPLPDGKESHIPIDERSNVIINYRGKVTDFANMSYSGMGKGLSDQLNNESSPARDQLPILKDNIVVIGVTIAGNDAGVTPLDPDAPNVVTHLNVLNNILQNDFLRPLSAWVWVPIYAIFLFGLGYLMLLARFTTMLAFPIVAILMVAVFGFALLCFVNLQTPVAMPCVGILLLAIAVPSRGFFGVGREKEILKNAMRACLSEKVMNKMLAHPDNVKLGGEKHVITVMFCDIRGFTKYCDNKDSAEVMDVLNDYMEAMTQVVFKYDGTVDKYIGDCIMAFWNAPEAQADHAQRAVCCAMEMRYALANFKTKRAGLDIELFECGIGIHTGEALVGMMGSSIKRNYTAMGSTVNMGARLEALTKRLNERILISQATLDELVGDFPITDRGEATVAGFAQPVHVYAVGADQDITSALQVGRTLAEKQEYTADEVTAPIWKPAPLPQDADPNP